MKKADFLRLKAEELEAFRDPAERWKYYSKWFEGEEIQEPVGWEKWRVGMFIELASSALRGRVLDAGCGAGENTVHYIEKASIIVATDLIPSAVLKAKMRSRRIDGCAGDCQALPFRNQSFDGVVSTDVIEHLPDDLLFLREIQRVLKGGGTAFVATPNANFPFFYEPLNWILMRTRGFPRYEGSLGRGHCRLYGEAELVHLAERAGFEAESVRFGGWLVALAYWIQTRTLAFPDAVRGLIRMGSETSTLGTESVEHRQPTESFLGRVRRTYISLARVVIGRLCEVLCSLDEKLVRNPRSTVYIAVLLRKR